MTPNHLSKNVNLLSGKKRGETNLRYPVVNT
jgi:hypothetical protein